MKSINIQKYATPKNLLFLGLFVVISLTIYNLFFKDKKEEDAEDINPAKDKLPPTRDGSTISNIYLTKCKQIAGAQYDAMNQWGTDEERLFSTLKDLNGKALQMVYRYFGKPKYSGIGRSTLIGEDRTLFGWYAKELNDSELDKMKKIWYKSGLAL